MRALPDIDLKRVHELVADHVIGLAEARRERQDDARFEAFGKAAGPFADRAGTHVGLREIRMARIQHDHLPLRERVVEQLRITSVPTLGHPRGLASDPFFFRVVVDVEVLGAKRPEFEARVLNLVPAEILRVSRGTGRAARSSWRDTRIPTRTEPWAPLS